MKNLLISVLFSVSFFPTGVFANTNPDSANSCGQIEMTEFSVRPDYYIGTHIDDYIGGNTYISFSGGQASITLYAYSPRYSITRCEWSGEYNGDCDRWFISPMGTLAYINVYALRNYDHGEMRIACNMYSGNTFVGTAYYYFNVMSEY